MSNSALVIDTDSNCTPHLDSLKARGVRKIGRYYSSRGWKRLTRTEAQAICAAGFEIFTVFEDTGSPELSIDQGRHDAQIAFSQAKAIGQPEGTPIYFAMEALPHGYSPNDVPGLKLYFEGVRRTLKGIYKVGVYSNGSTLDALLEAKLCDYPWLSASLSFAGSRDFAMSGRWVLMQRQIDLNWSGVSVDTNDSKEDFGAFTLDVTDTGGEEPAEAPREMHPAVIMAKSPTIWSIGIGTAAAVVREIANTVGGWFGHIPDIASDVDGIMQPTTHLLDILRVNTPEIALVIGIACIAIAMIRHTDLHREKGKP